MKEDAGWSVPPPDATPDILDVLAAVARAAGAQDVAVARVDRDGVRVTAGHGRWRTDQVLDVDAEALGALRRGEAVEVAPHRRADGGDAAPVHARVVLAPMRGGGVDGFALAFGWGARAALGAVDFGAVTALAALAAWSGSGSGAAGAAARSTVDLAMLVHDLRAPITVIRGYATLVRDGAFAQDAVRLDRALATIGAEADSLARTVDDICAAAGTHEQGGAAGTATLDCAELVGRAASRAAGRAAIAGGSVTCDVPDGLSVRADAVAVDRILDNLLVNAFAYGGPKPHVALAARSDGATVTIRVCDSGPGVPATLGDRVFDRFVRGASSAPGSGLGLYISRGLAERMGGSLVLEPGPPDTPTAFALALPRA